MSLKYYKYQNQNAKNLKAFGKWYGRAVVNETVGIEQIASEMQDNCTVKRADILAVLSELGPVMKRLMQDSKRVKIPYLGSFKLGISTEGADSENEFSAKNVKGVHVVFQPLSVHQPDGRRLKEMADGCRVVEYKNVQAGERISDGGSSGSSGSGPDIDDLP